MSSGHMTHRELTLLDGDILQVVPLKEHEREPVIVQKRPVGRHHAVRIGTGWHGMNIRLSFFHPERSDTLAGIDTRTGETIFAGAQKTEILSRGSIHAHDFPAHDKSTVSRETDVATISGIHLRRLKHTKRAHWENIASRSTKKKPQQTKILEDDIPWDAPTNPPHNGHYVIR